MQTSHRSPQLQSSTTSICAVFPGQQFFGCRYVRPSYLLRWIKGTDSARKRWQNQYFTDLIREDIIEFSRIHEIRSIAVLLEMLRTRTGSPLSFDALGREIGVSSNTVRSYIEILESLHIVFLVRPYHRNVARALSKAPKLYFYDWAYVNDAKDNSSDSGARFENLVACHLLKHVQFLADSEGSSLQLHYASGIGRIATFRSYLFTIALAQLRWGHPRRQLSAQAK